MQSSPERQPDVRCKMTDLVGPVTMQVRPATSASTPLSGGRCRVRHFWQSGDMRQSCTSANLAVTLCHDNHAECLLCDSASAPGLHLQQHIHSDVHQAAVPPQPLCHPSRAAEQAAAMRRIL